ncbi:MAG: phosphotransferase [Clostridia bacterium]|nr:phosphotransferase [Clostridia bacterium]
MKKIIQKYLGIKKPEITKMDIGSQNETYDINGKYVLKVFSKDAVANDKEKDLRELKEMVAEVFKDKGVPMVLPLMFKDRYIQGDNPYFVIYPKVKMKSVTRDEITDEHILAISNFVAKMHNIRVDVPALKHKKEKFAIDVDKYIRLYNLNNKMNVTLRENKELIEKLQRKINNAIDSLKSKEVISHNDLKLDNVLWDKFNPYFIDFDAVGYVNHMCAANEYAYVWCTKNGKIDLKRYELFMANYLKYHYSLDNFEDVLYMTLYGKFSWLRYSLDRGRSKDEEQAKQGINAVVHLLKDFTMYERTIPGMLRVLEKLVKKDEPVKNTGIKQLTNYHSHTYRCRHADDTVTDEDYVKEYIKAGFKEIAFTDHVPQKNVIDTRKRMRMDYSEKEDYLNSVRHLKEKYKDKINIKVGFEIEYLPEHLEEFKELKEECDLLVLGQHYTYDRKNNEVKVFNEKIRPEFSDDEIMEHYEYMKEAVEHNLVKIIVHPDMYMCVRKEFGEFEEKIARKIASLAEKHNIILEINLMDIFKHMCGKKQNIEYPNREFWRIVSEYDVPVIYGIDAHFRGQIRSHKEMIKFTRAYLGKDIVSKLKFVEDCK